MGETFDIVRANDGLTTGRAVFLTLYFDMYCLKTIEKYTNVKPKPCSLG